MNARNLYRFILGHSRKCSTVDESTTCTSWFYNIKWRAAPASKTKRVTALEQIKPTETYSKVHCLSPWIKGRLTHTLYVHKHLKCRRRTVARVSDILPMGVKMTIQRSHPMSHDSPNFLPSIGGKTRPPELHTKKVALSVNSSSIQSCISYIPHPGNCGILIVKFNTAWPSVGHSTAHEYDLV